MTPAELFAAAESMPPVASAWASEAVSFGNKEKATWVRREPRRFGGRLIVASVSEFANHATWFVYERTPYREGDYPGKRGRCASVAETMEQADAFLTRHGWVLV